MREKDTAVETNAPRASQEACNLARRMSARSIRRLPHLEDPECSDCKPWTSSIDCDK